MSVTPRHGAPGRPSLRTHLLFLPWLLVAAAGIAAAWVLIALYLGRPLNGAAFVVAADMALVVRLAKLPRGTTRGLLAAAGTALGIALAIWWTVASRVGIEMGMPPWEGIPLMGAGFAWVLAQMSYTPMEWAMFAAAVLLAAVLGR